MIKIQNVSKRYRNVNALSDFSLEVPHGAIYGLIGPNGAGKTTLLRILAALLVPTTGQVWFDNEEISRHPSVIQRKVGYMPDFFGVYPDLTSVEYLEFYAGIHGIPRQKRPQIIADLLELVDLSSKRDALVESLSRGMKQRLCLARALVHDPEVLLLDEPASGLDPRARVELRELLRTLQSMGKTVIISSHILLELAEMCSDVAIVQGGRLIVSGNVEQVSRRLSSGRQLEIRVLERGIEASEILKEIPGVSAVSVMNAVNATSAVGAANTNGGHGASTNGESGGNNNMLQADFDGDDKALHLVLASLISHGIPVVSFAPRSSGGRLEEVFMSITEGNSPS